MGSGELSFAVVILLGPGEIEVDRTLDLLDAIGAYEPAAVAVSDLFVVNDNNSDAPRLHAATRAFAGRHLLSNPLAGEKYDRFDKHTAGVLCALAEAAKHGPYRFVLKLDTDALVVAPFADKLDAFFGDQPKVGMAGSYLRSPDGRERARNEWWDRRIARAARRPGRRHHLLHAAKKHGYREGDHVLGGSYALSGEALPHLAVSEYLFQGTALGEDAVVSLLVRAAGYELADFNRPGEVFGVWFRDLEQPPDVLARDYSVIHSLKSTESQDEAELRRIFKEFRQTASAGS